VRALHFVEIWGSGKGPLLRVSPRARLLAGTLLFFGCLWSAPDVPAGFVAVVAVVLIWLRATGIPKRYLGPLLVYGLLVFLPVFLLVPWIGAETSGTIWERAVSFEALRPPWRIFVRGLSGMLVATATVSAMTVSELYASLIRLPLPRLATSILVQIVHQTGLLFHETARVARAIAVRGGTSGWKAGLLVARSIPAVWLPRVLFKAERVGAAMELRGYGGPLPAFDLARVRASDVLVVAGAGAILVGMIALRVML
jgi:cobalt/nickel transport system permease protein